MTEPTNDTRADRAREALELHGGKREDFRTRLIDLLADLHHLAVQEIETTEDVRTVMENAMFTAQVHFAEERREGGGV